MAKRSTSRVQEGTARSRIGGSEPLQRVKLGKGSYFPSMQKMGFVPNLTYTAIFMKVHVYSTPEKKNKRGRKKKEKGKRKKESCIAKNHYLRRMGPFPKDGHKFRSL